MDGQSFLAGILSAKNVILNVSGVVFRREVLLAAMDSVGAELETYRVAGDWRLYAEICAAGSTIAFEARPLNGHRRHSKSVTHALAAKQHYHEIRNMQFLAATRVTVTSTAHDAAEIHLEEVRAVLGLTKDDIEDAA